MNTFQVIVSNVGTVYDGNEQAQAQAAYDQAKADSVNVIGRAAGEDVTLMFAGAPMTEYQGVLSQEAPEDTDGCTKPSCKACALRRAILARLDQRTMNVPYATQEEAGKAAMQRAGKPTLTTCEGIPELLALVQGQKAAHYISPWHAGAFAYSEYRTPAMPATVQLVEGDGGMSLTVRVNNKEYVIQLDVEDNNN